MKTLLKIFVAIVLILVLAAGGILIYLTSSFPKVGPAADITIESTPERIARGKYLAQHVSGCIACHSTRNWNYFAGPIVPGTEGKGGERFGEEGGLPGTFYSGNISPSGIGDWTDGEIVRTITSGVNKNGKALFPLMPYLSYNKMSEEDVYAVVAYIKTLKPIANEIPVRQLNFPMNLIVRTIPQPYIPRQRPNISDTVAYGEYMTTIGGCASCHTPQEKSKPIEGLDFAGGFEFVLPGGQVVRSSNITPDIGTGIGSWSKENFIGVFKSFASFSELVEEDGDNTTMPWLVYAGMTEADLGAIYTGAYRTWGRPPKRPRVSRIPTETGGKTGKMRGILGKNAIVPQLIYAPHLYFWTLDKMNGFWGRKRENGTEKGTRHCFAPRLRGWGLD